MVKPKGVALVQANRPGRPIAEFETAYLGDLLWSAAPDQGRHLTVHWNDGVAIVTIKRPEALNALSDDLLGQLEAVVASWKAPGRSTATRSGRLLLRGSGRAFMAGADVTGFVGKDPG